MVAEDVATQFANLAVVASLGALAATTGWGIFIGDLPLDPRTAIGFKETGGKTPNPKWAIDYPSVQAVVRGDANDWAAAKQKAKDVKNAFLGLTSQDVGADRWVSVLMLGDIQDLGRDENNCPRFSINFSLIIQPGDTGNRQALP